MGFFSGLIGAKDTLNAAGNVIEKTGKVFDKLFTSDDERLSHAEMMQRIKQQPYEKAAKFAHELNVISASDSKLFNSGWRPCIGWVLAISIGFYFIPKFFFGSLIWVKHCWLANEIVAYPVDDAGLWQLAAMMLGSKAIRSFDKYTGQSK